MLKVKEDNLSQFWLYYNLYKTCAWQTNYQNAQYYVQHNQNDYTSGHVLASDISSSLSTTAVKGERVGMAVNRRTLSYTVSV
jgi:hypothetical protein